MSFTFPPRKRVLNPSFNGKPERVFERLEHQLSDAERLGDRRVLERLLSDLLMILGTNWTKEDWIQMLVAGKGTFINLEKSSMAIRIFGDTVVVTGSQDVDSKTPNSSSMYSFNFMNTWKRDKSGAWICIAMASDQIKGRN